MKCVRDYTEDVSKISNLAVEVVKKRGDIYVSIDITYDYMSVYVNQITYMDPKLKSNDWLFNKTITFYSDSAKERLESAKEVLTKLLEENEDEREI